MAVPRAFSVKHFTAANRANRLNAPTGTGTESLAMKRSIETRGRADHKAPRSETLNGIKACLDQLSTEAQNQHAPLAALLIAAASEACRDAVFPKKARRPISRAA